MAGPSREEKLRSEYLLTKISKITILGKKNFFRFFFFSVSRFKKTIIKIKNTYFLFYCFPKISSNDLPKKKKRKIFSFLRNLQFP